MEEEHITGLIDKHFFIMIFKWLLILFCCIMIGKQIITILAWLIPLIYSW